MPTFVRSSLLCALCFLVACGDAAPGTSTDAGGVTDSGSSLCTPGSTADCYSGPEGTSGVGLCKPGKKTCLTDGSGYGACVGEVTPTDETCLTPGDDDCNGQVNESGDGCVCVPNEKRACYSGAAGTKDVGLCKGGEETCNSTGTGYGACDGEVTPKTEDCATPDDEDCDGQGTSDAEDGCLCVPGDKADCYTGPAGTKDVGLCKGGQQTCQADGKNWGACDGEILPSLEVCATPGDDDCNGQANEGGPDCSCTPTTTRDCYDADPATLDVGPCKGGTQTCIAAGTGYDACMGQVTPVKEDCTTTIDEDCDGQTLDAEDGCVCVPGTTQGCYSGPAGTKDVGACKGGTQTCAADGKSWGTCADQVTPVAESCLTTGDDDCNGQSNEICICTPGSTANCYSGPAGTDGVGLCHGGTKTCNAQGTAYGSCTGEVVPATESCSTTGDDNCDGQSNEGCICVPNSTASCYDGPGGTAGVGLCHSGTKTCNAQGTAYGTCTGEVVPQASESCSTTGDDDCDGQSNEGCICVPGSTVSCYGGPAATLGVGLCHAGTSTCNAQGTGYSGCTGDVQPAASESCSTPGDDDCNGMVNEGCPPPKTYATDAKPIFQAHCAACHGGGGSGGHNIATSYADSQHSSYYCPGKTVGECALIRIREGSMPQGAGCSGNPVTDFGNPNCLTAAEQQTLQDWINGGQQP